MKVMKGFCIFVFLIVLVALSSTTAKAYIIWNCHDGNLTVIEMGQIPTKDKNGNFVGWEDTVISIKSGMVCKTEGIQVFYLVRNTDGPIIMEEETSEDNANGTKWKSLDKTSAAYLAGMSYLDYLVGTKKGRTIRLTQKFALNLLKRIENNKVPTIRIQIPAKPFLVSFKDSLKSINKKVK